MLLCRAALGIYKEFAEQQVDPRACERAVMEDDFHSIIGDRVKARGTFREFIVFDDDQIYVEYVIWYRRAFFQETLRG